MIHVKKYAGVCAAALVLGLVLAATASAAPKVPPSIGDLDGAIFQLKVSGTGYDLTTGLKEKVKGNLLVLMTVIDSTHVALDFDDLEVDDRIAYYDSRSGVMIIGEVNAVEAATEALAGYFQISGTPGKMKLKGESNMFELLSDMEAEILKFKGKQTTQTMQVA